MDTNIKVVGLMALWKHQTWENSLQELLYSCDRVFLQFDIRGGDWSIPVRAKKICGDKLDKLIFVDEVWSRWKWRERLLRMLDDYKPDIVLFPDEDERFSCGLSADIWNFMQSDKKYMMFEYEMVTQDLRTVPLYPKSPHMKVFKWQPGLTYHPYPTLAKLASYKGEGYKAQSKIYHYCYYTEEMEKQHLNTPEKKIVNSKKNYPLHKFWARIIRYKVYFDRSRVYIGYLQFIMMLLVMLKVYEDSNFGRWFFTTWWAFPAFLILFFGGSIVIGYLDKKFVRSHEQKEIVSTNPVIMEILKYVKK